MIPVPTYLIGLASVPRVCCKCSLVHVVSYSENVYSSMCTEDHRAELKSSATIQPSRGDALKLVRLTEAETGTTLVKRLFTVAYIFWMSNEKDPC